MYSIIQYYTIPRSAPATAQPRPDSPGPEVQRDLGSGYAPERGVWGAEPPRVA